jgi:hypothetical protein
MYCWPKNSDNEKTSRRNSILTSNNQYRTSNLSIYQVYLLVYTNSSTTWNRPLSNPDSCWMISIYFILFVFSHLHIRSNLASSSRPTFVNLAWKKTWQDMISFTQHPFWINSMNFFKNRTWTVIDIDSIMFWFDDWFRLYLVPLYIELNWI